MTSCSTVSSNNSISFWCLFSAQWVVGFYFFFYYHLFVVFVLMAIAFFNSDFFFFSWFMLLIQEQAKNSSKSDMLHFRTGTCCYSKLFSKSYPLQGEQCQTQHLLGKAWSVTADCLFTILSKSRRPSGTKQEMKDEKCPVIFLGCSLKPKGLKKSSCCCSTKQQSFQHQSALFLPVVPKVPRAARQAQSWALIDSISFSKRTPEGNITLIVAIPL